MKTACAVSLGLLLLSAAGCHRHTDSGGEPAPASSAASSAPAAAPETSPDVPSLMGFEGEIDLRAKAKSSPNPIAVNLLIKNDIVRFDLPSELINVPDAQRFTGGGKVYAVLKAAEKQVTVVLDAKREAVLVNLDGLADKAKAMRPTVPGAPEPAPAEPPKVVKTGKKDTVAGLPCEEWDVRNADKSRERVCVAEKGASFFQLPLTGIPTEQAWALELLDGKHFPLRGVGFDKDGAESGRVEVTKLDKHTLDASLFEVPAGYKQMTVDEFIQTLGGGVPTDVNPNGRRPHGGHRHGKHGG